MREIKFRRKDGEEGEDGRTMIGGVGVSERAKKK